MMPSVKKVLLFFVASVLFSASSAAAAEPLGLYIAPKLVFGYAQMENTKFYDKEDGVGTIYSISFSDDGDTTFGGALAVGYDFDKRFQFPVRAELEYAVFTGIETKKNDSDYDLNGDFRHYDAKHSIDIQTLFVNLYYDFKTGTDFTPYLGAGAGVAFLAAKPEFEARYPSDPDLNYEVDFGKETRANFAWNIGAGIGWKMTECLDLDLGYRFASLGEAKFSTDSDDGITAFAKTENVYMHQLMLGLRWNF